MGTGSNDMAKLSVNFSIPQYNKFEPLNGFDKLNLHRIHMGERHAFAADTNGHLYGWGDNTDNKLGLGIEVMYSQYPREIPYFAQQKKMIRYADGGSAHSVIIAQDGSVYSMGSNASSQLGRLTGDSSPSLIDLSNLAKGETPIEVHTQMFTTFILTDQNNVYVWGPCRNSLCGPGHDEMEQIAIPTLMQLNLKVKAMFVGMWGFFVQTVDTLDLYSLGNNANGELCQPLGDLNFSAPQLIPNFKNVSHAASNRYHTVFTKDQKAYGCGTCRNGAFGVMSNDTWTTPTLIGGGLGNIISATTTANGTFLLTDQGLFSTGYESRGELGYGVGGQRQQNQFLPVNVTGITGIQTVVAHFDYAFIYAQQKQSGNGLSAGAICGIIFGILGAIAVVIGIWWIVKKGGVGRRPKYAAVNENNKLVFNDDQW